MIENWKQNDISQIIQNIYNTWNTEKRWKPLQRQSSFPPRGPNLSSTFSSIDEAFDRSTLVNLTLTFCFEFAFYWFCKCVCSYINPLRHIQYIKSTKKTKTISEFINANTAANAACKKNKKSQSYFLNTTV